jgi:hypothetical protein
MADLDKALATQIENIKTRTGKSLEQLYALLKKRGDAKHGALRDYLKTDLGMGHGDANTVVTLFLKQASGAEEPANADDAVAALYVGPKAALRPIHDAVMKAISKFGAFDVAPKKTYVSLRRKKQFAMMGPATKTQVEIGLNVAELKASPRLTVVPPGGMCAYKTRLGTVAEVDAELISWIKKAFDAAG